jgi:hypothetical protein
MSKKLEQLQQLEDDIKRQAEKNLMNSQLTGKPLIDPILYKELAMTMETSFKQVTSKIPEDIIVKFSNDAILSKPITVDLKKESNPDLDKPLTSNEIIERKTKELLLAKAMLKDVDEVREKLIEHARNPQDTTSSLSIIDKYNEKRNNGGKR